MRVCFCHVKTCKLRIGWHKNRVVANCCSLPKPVRRVFVVLSDQEPLSTMFQPASGSQGIHAVALKPSAGSTSIAHHLATFRQTCKVRGAPETSNTEQSPDCSHGWRARAYCRGSQRKGNKVTANNRAGIPAPPGDGSTLQRSRTPQVCVLSKSEAWRTDSDANIHNDEGVASQETHPYCGPGFQSMAPFNVDRAFRLIRLGPDHFPAQSLNIPLCPTRLISGRRASLQIENLPPEFLTGFGALRWTRRRLRRRSQFSKPSGALSSTFVRSHSCWGSRLLRSCHTRRVQQRQERSMAHTFPVLRSIILPALLIPIRRSN